MAKSDKNHLATLKQLEPVSSIVPIFLLKDPCCHLGKHWVRLEHRVAAGGLEVVLGLDVVAQGVGRVEAGGAVRARERLQPKVEADNVADLEKNI